MTVRLTRWEWTLLYLEILALASLILGAALFELVFKTLWRSCDLNKAN